MIGIDKVYQKVLAIANKEQRGYITPQEFNLFADYAQMEIFEQYFYDLSQQKRRIESSDIEHTNPVSIIEEKLSNFKKDISVSSPFQLKNINNFYRIERVYENPFDSSKHSIIEYEKTNKNYSKHRTTLLTPTAKRPHYTLSDGVVTTFTVAPGIATHELRLSYIKKPESPNWTYYINNGNALYNATSNNHMNFELHPSEENKLIIKILQLSGVTIKDFNLVQTATQEEIKKIQQEKQ
jgi:hypothetical protein